MSFLTIGSVKRRPISRLMAKNVFSGLVTAWRLAACPTRRSPDSVNATIEGVVRMPSLFSITLAFLPSMTATQEFVVPRSIPITLLMDTSSQKQDQTARRSTVLIPRENECSANTDWRIYMAGETALQPARAPKPAAKSAFPAAPSRPRAAAFAVSSGGVRAVAGAPLFRRLLGDPDHRRAQQPVVNDIARLQDLDDG